MRVFLIIFAFGLITVYCSQPPGYEENDDYTTFSSVKVDDLDRKEKNDAKKYFSNYGYTATYTDKTMKLNEVIKDFQYFAGLLVTGELDSTTLKWMKKNRCGLKDPSVTRKRKDRGLRVKRFNRQGSYWRKSVLTWKYIHNKMGNNAYERDPVEGLTEKEIKDLLRKAMSLWERRTNIEFVEKNDPYTSRADEPDILISFGSRNHANDPFPFDGYGGTLAHAFYPLNNVGFAGDVHFDDDETFTINNRIQGAKDLLWVATHELGHSLGLDHSSEQDAVMYPFYMGYRDNFDLKYDDIIGMQSIYGGKIQRPQTTQGPIKRKTTTPAPPPPPTTPVPARKVCPTSKITAIWEYQRDNNYFMITTAGKLYTVDSIKGMVDRNIDQSEYYNIPYAIDAVYQTDLGQGVINDVIFTSIGYYLYSSFKRVSGPHDYKSESFNEVNFCKDKRPNDPTPLKLNFPSQGRNAIQKIDAVMKWQRNKKVYFFTGNKYWRYDETTRTFDCGYPRMIAPAWRGLRGKVDAAYSSAEKTIFTQGDMLYEFNDRLVHTEKGYPRSLSNSLLKCEEPSVDERHSRKRRHIQRRIKLSYDRHVREYLDSVFAPEP